MIKLKKLILESKKHTGEKTLCSNKWLSLKQVTLPNSEDGYVFSHETRCNGKIIAILLYRRIGKDAWEYGVRKEVTPAWGTEPNLSALTGGVEKDQTPIECAIQEIKEESGYIVIEKDLEDLGTCFGTKSTDTIFYLYAVDVDDKELGEKTGDGTAYDNEGEIEWMYYDKTKINCPILSTLILRRGLH